jgi:alpha-L-fucosidase
MGLYHSLYEWFHPLYLQDKASGGNKTTGYNTSRYVDEVLYPQQLEINKLYKPDLIWSDGDADAPSSYWRAPELLAWLYNDGAGTADTVVVNDRWGSDNPPISSGKHFGGYFSGTDRQQASKELLGHKWENAFTLDKTSWGYARNDMFTNYLNITTVLYEVISTVAYGGNALINVGPTADGRIATIFQERLSQLGEWLDVNGEAIYGTAKWREQNDTAMHGVELGVYYTASKKSAAASNSTTVTIYAHAMGWPDDNILVLSQPVGAATTTVRMLGCEKPMNFTLSPSGGIIISIPPLSPKQLPSLTGPWVFELIGVQ